jgi:tRNA threonylcarbamoyladenosine biosynthesis protein TsaB
LILLALETATTVCSAALLRDERVEVELVLNRPRAHAENLVPVMRDVLRFAGVAPAAVTAVAISSGPGSYTGLRIGASAAKGFATAVDAALVAVPSLEALAAGVRAFATPGDLIATAFDARRDEVYAAAFRLSSDGRLRAHRETSVVSSREMAAWLGVGDTDTLWLAGDGWTKMVADLREACVSYRMLAEDDVAPSAATVARIGADRFLAGRIEDVVTFEPYYYKEFVATRPATGPLEKLAF